MSWIIVRNMMKKIEIIFNRIIRHTRWYNDKFWNGALKFGRQTFNTEIVCLGSGAAVHDFNFEGLQLKGANWALSPQSLVHDYSILRNYFSYLKEGAVVIITICPFSCLYSHYSETHNFKYYPFLHPATILNFDDSERTRAFLVYQNPFKVMPVYCIKSTIKEIIYNIKHFFLCHKHTPNFVKSAENILNGWMNQFNIKDLEAPLSSCHQKEKESRKKTLIEMIVFCKERNLNPIIVIPPMHAELVNRFPSLFLKNYINDFLLGIDVKVYDCMNCKIVNENKYFENALFLNQLGAKMFTNWFVDELKKDYTL